MLEFVAYARRRYPDRGRFRCKRVSRLSASQAHDFELVLASALHHHLNDDEARDLFGVAAGALKPEGFLVTHANAYLEGQPMLERYMVSRDRGHTCAPPCSTRPWLGPCSPGFGHRREATCSGSLTVIFP